MPPTYKTLLAPAQAPLRVLDSSEVRLMPFHLAHTGPAQTDVYFQPRAAHPTGLGYVSTEVEDVKKGDGTTGRIAAFRGREVHEHLVTLPRGYVGCVLSAPPRPTRRTEDIATSEQPTEPTVREEEISTQRSMRKRKAPVERAPVAKRTTRKAVEKVKRFSLDDDEDSENGEGVAEASQPIGETEESQVEAQTPVDEPVAETKDEPTGDREDVPPPLHHTTSLAIVDSMIPEETDHTSPPPPTEEPSSWIQTRRLVPEATFEAISIWHADEPMYTVPTGEMDEGTEEKEDAKGDVRGLMGERDEFVRALDEWRRVSEIVHSW